MERIAFLDSNYAYEAGRGVVVAVNKWDLLEGYTAADIDPLARGVGWLLSETGVPRRMKAAYLTDEDIIDLAAWAARARAHRPVEPPPEALGTVIPLHGKDDAA